MSVCPSLKGGRLQRLSPASHCSVCTRYLFLALAEERLLGIIGIYEIPVPIVRCVGLGNQPRLVQSLDDIIRQGALLNSIEVAVKLAVRTNTNKDAIIAILDLELRVVHRPAQRRLDHAQAATISLLMFRHGLLDLPQRIERAILEVATLVILARPGRVAEPALGRLEVLALDLAAEEAPRYGVVDHDVEAEPSACRHQLGLDPPRNRVVHRLVDRRPHPSVVLARQHHLGYLGRREVRQTEPHELARLVQLVDRLERLRERRRAVGAVEV